MNFNYKEESAKQKKLIELYTQMAEEGYTTIDQQTIENAFSDMEIIAFQDLVKPLFESYGIKSLLDYGCGGSDYELAGFTPSGESAKQFFNLEKVYRYEPARDLDERIQADAVVNFDVLEHIFIADIPRVIRELFSLTKKLLVINVACYNARALLPNGENAHITVRPPEWWRGVINAIAVEYPDITVKLYCSVGWRNVLQYPPFKVDDWLNADKFTIPLEQ